MHIDHITIRTSDLIGTKNFLLKVFDELQEGERPKAIHRIPGHWLFANGKPIVHLIGTHGYGSNDAPEALDHVGFHLQGYDRFLSKLKALGIPYSAMELAELNERRLFLYTPTGVLLEAVFNEQPPED